MIKRINFALEASLERVQLGPGKTHWRQAEHVTQTLRLHTGYLFLDVLELWVEQLDEHRDGARLDHKFRLLRRPGGDVGQSPRRFELNTSTDINVTSKDFIRWRDLFYLWGKGENK